MYSLLKNIELKTILMSETPGLGLAIILSEVFYKFGSFTLECLAFLSTWYLLSFSLNFINNLIKQGKN